MAQTYTFPGVATLPRRSHHAKRTLEDKIAEICRRSPKDRTAFDTLADMVLTRLDTEDARRGSH